MPHNDPTTLHAADYPALVADAEIYTRRVPVPANDSDVYTPAGWRELQALARELGWRELPLEYERRK